VSVREVIGSVRVRVKSFFVARGEGQFHLSLGLIVEGEFNPELPEDREAINQPVL